jgi:hypothetical protein
MAAMLSTSLSFVGLSESSVNQCLFLKKNSFLSVIKDALENFVLKCFPKTFLQQDLHARIWS